MLSRFTILRVPSSTLLTPKSSTDDDENLLEKWGASLTSPKLSSSGISGPAFALEMGESCPDAS